MQISVTVEGQEGLTWAHRKQSERLHFGSLVAPVSFRDPVMFACQAAAIDDLSDGRPFDPDRM